jgi:hypothetical protein
LAQNIRDLNPQSQEEIVDKYVVFSAMTVLQGVSLNHLWPYAYGLFIKKPRCAAGLSLLIQL